MQAIAGWEGSLFSEIRIPAILYSLSSSTNVISNHQKYFNSLSYYGFESCSAISNYLNYHLFCSQRDLLVFKSIQRDSCLLRIFSQRTWIQSIQMLVFSLLIKSKGKDLTSEKWSPIPLIPKPSMSFARSSTVDEDPSCVLGVTALSVGCLGLNRAGFGAPGGVHSFGGFMIGVRGFLAAMKASNMIIPMFKRLR